MTMTVVDAASAATGAASGRRPLTILQVGSCFPEWGGTEFHMLRLSEELVRRGHRVTVACRPGRFVEEQARMRGLPTLAATVAKQQDWRDRGVFQRFIREQQVDVVHVHWSGDYIVAPTVARLCRVPAVVMSRHSPDLLRSASGRFLYGQVLFDRIIAVSESVRGTLLGQGLPPTKVVTIHNSVDPKAIRRTTLAPEDQRTAWGVPADAFLVGMVGRVAWEKGVPIFLEALSRLRDTPVHGVIVGDGPQMEAVRTQAKELNLGDRLTFAGFRSDPNNALLALDVLALASVWQEPCATVVMEAMALRKPVIGTDIGGTPEMIASGETGLLVPPSDADALAAAIRELARDPTRCARLGDAGRARVQEKFTLARMTESIENLYYEQGARRKSDIAAVASNA